MCDPNGNNRTAEIIGAEEIFAPRRRKKRGQPPLNFEFSYFCEVLLLSCEISPLLPLWKISFWPPLEQNPLFPPHPAKDLSDPCARAVTVQRVWGLTGVPSKHKRRRTFRKIISWQSKTCRESTSSAEALLHQHNLKQALLSTPKLWKRKSDKNRSGSNAFVTSQAGAAVTRSAPWSATARRRGTGAWWRPWASVGVAWAWQCWTTCSMLWEDTTALRTWTAWKGEAACFACSFAVISVGTRWGVLPRGGKKLNNPAFTGKLADACVVPCFWYFALQRI